MQSENYLLALRKYPAFGSEEAREAPFGHSKTEPPRDICKKSVYKRSLMKRTDDEIIGAVAQRMRVKSIKNHSSVTLFIRLCPVDGLQ
jgi:hypothetical protein